MFESFVVVCNMILHDSVVLNLLRIITLAFRYMQNNLSFVSNAIINYFSITGPLVFLHHAITVRVK